IDVYSADTAVTIGDPPQTAVRLTGTIDAASITDKFKALGATSRTFGDIKGLTTGGDDQTNVDSPVVKATQTVNELNQIVVTNHELAVSPDSDSLQAVLNSGGRSLLDTGSYRGVSDCLGDVVTAMFTPRRARATLLSSRLAFATPDPRPHRRSKSCACCRPMAIRARCTLRSAEVSP
ncbi:MAG: hypothetical protein ABI232_12650, partial [Jatrophihabitantaceae bacterium]